MSVILDALERAKQERSRRKTPTRSGSSTDGSQIHAQDEIALAGSDPYSQPSPGPQAPVRQPSSMGAALFVIATMLVLLLATTVGLLAYLFLERERERSTPSAVQTGNGNANTPSATSPLPPNRPDGVANPGGPATQPVAELPIAGAPLPGMDSNPLIVPGGYPPQPQQPVYGLPAPTVLLPKLGSIICDERGCTAMLDGRSAREGDAVGDFQILEVTQDAVTLRDPSGRLHSLSMRR